MAGTACDDAWPVPLGPTAKMVLGVAPIPLSPPMLLVAPGVCAWAAAAPSRLLMMLLKALSILASEARSDW
jgi:hypothetical protein